MGTCIIQVNEPVYAARGIQTALNEVWNLCNKAQDVDGTKAVEQAMKHLAPLSGRNLPEFTSTTVIDSPVFHTEPKP